MRNLALSFTCLVLSATCLAQGQHHLYTFNGLAAGDWFGSSVSEAGDVNQDNYPDVIVGAGLGNYARVFSGKDGKVLHTFNGLAAGDWFGWSVGGAGDVDKDGYADLIVGSPFGGKNTGGYARVFSGKDGKILHTLDGPWISSFGQSVGGAGDVNQDGFADFIVGAPDLNNNSRGIARVFSGKDGNLIYELRGLYGEWFGHSVASGSSMGGAGDVNKDGFPDLIVGAPYGGLSGGGYVRVVSGKDGKTTLRTFYGRGRFGFSVSGAGDVNGDGHADVIVGADFDSKIKSRAGSARVFSGKDGKALRTFNGDAANDKFGTSVGGAGDVNGDGIPDLIVGALNGGKNGGGYARIFSGKDYQILHTFDGDSKGDQFGISAGGVGDLNKDGHGDVIVGAWFDDNNGRNASGSARVLSGKALSLATDSHAFSLAKANTQTLNLDAGAVNKGRSYWVFGSYSGTTPGVTLASAIGAVTIPLNYDRWTDITIGLANSAVLVNTKGTFDASGKAKAMIKGGPVKVPSAIGLVLYHAYLVYDQSNNFYMASNPVTLRLEK